MKKKMLRFLPVLILFLVACNLSNAVNTPVSTITPTIAPTTTLLLSLVILAMEISPAL
ncbi:MAG: hypothetical protein QM730_17230 [Anaerolineales bacterium]